MRPPAAPVITVTDVPLAAATTADMQLVTTFTGAAAFATAVATETMHEMTRDVQLVEAFEED